MENAGSVALGNFITGFSQVFPSMIRQQYLICTLGIIMLIVGILAFFFLQFKAHWSKDDDDLFNILTIVSAVISIWGLVLFCRVFNPQYYAFQTFINIIKQ